MSKAKGEGDPFKDQEDEEEDEGPEKDAGGGDGEVGREPGEGATRSHGSRQL